jgi:NDP-sugar pyrophosphorylase family protein
MSAIRHSASRRRHHRRALLHRRRGPSAGARIGPCCVVGRQCWIEEHAALDHAIVWPNTRISQTPSSAGRSAGGAIGRSVLIENGVVLGDESVVTDYSRL